MLGMTSSNLPRWSFNIKLDEKNKAVLYRDAQLVSAIYGADSVQFYFKENDETRKMLLDLDRLTFETGFTDEISSLLRKGKCKRI